MHSVAEIKDLPELDSKRLKTEENRQSFGGVINKEPLSNGDVALDVVKQQTQAGLAIYTSGEELVRTERNQIDMNQFQPVEKAPNEDEHD